MTDRLSNVRLYAMRLVYLLIAFGLGFQAWSTIIDPAANLGRVDGVAYSFWAAFSALALLGVRFPVQMLPLLLLQLFYKLIWFSAVAYPLWSAGELDPMTDRMVRVFGMAVVADLIVIPWPYVFKHYIVSIFSANAAAPAA